MTLAAVAPVASSGNHTAIWVTVFVLLGVFAICAVLYQHERRSDRHEGVINEHDEQLGLLAGRIQALAEWLGVEISDPEDDSPEAMADVDQATEERDLGDRATTPDEAATDEFPALPSTEPMALIADPTPAVQARRDAAWDEQRPTPYPHQTADLMDPETAERRRIERAALVEEQLKRFDFSGRNR